MLFYEKKDPGKYIPGSLSFGKKSVLIKYPYLKVPVGTLKVHLVLSSASKVRSNPS